MDRSFVEQLRKAAPLPASMNSLWRSCYDFHDSRRFERRVIDVSLSGGFMVLEHRGFKATTDVVADELGVQWVCRATIERTDGNSENGGPQGIEFSLSRAKIDPLMAASVLEHRAVTLIDEWHKQGHR